MTVSILYEDGAENYSTTVGANISSLLLKGNWANAFQVSLTDDARTGAYAFRLTSPLSVMNRALPGNYTKGGVIMSYNADALPGGWSKQFALFRFANSENRTIASGFLMPSGRIRVVNGAGTVLGETTLAVSAGYHNHFEARLDLDGGTLTVRVNDKDNFTLTVSDPFLSFQSDTATYVLQPWVIFSIGNTDNGLPYTSAVTVDDIALYEFDDGDDYLGLYGVYYLKPIADGHYNDWTASVGTTRYLMVNTVAPDGDSTFDFTEDIGDKLSFPVEPLPVNVTDVQAVQVVTYGRKTDSGDGSVQLGVRSGSLDTYNGDDLPQLTDYGYHNAVFDLDPNTGDRWDPTGLPEIIIERTK